MIVKTELQPSILAAELVYGPAPEIPEWLQIAGAYLPNIKRFSADNAGWLLGNASDADVLVPFPRDVNGKITGRLSDFLPEGSASLTIPVPEWPAVELRNTKGTYFGIKKNGMFATIAPGWIVEAYVLWLHEGRPSVDLGTLFWTPPNYKTNSVARAGLIEAAFQRLPEDMLTRVSARLGKPWLWMSPEVVDVLAEEVTR